MLVLPFLYFVVFGGLFFSHFVPLYIRDFYLAPFQFQLRFFCLSPIEKVLFDALTQRRPDTTPQMLNNDYTPAALVAICGTNTTLKELQLATLLITPTGDYCLQGTYVPPDSTSG